MAKPGQPASSPQGRIGWKFFTVVLLALGALILLFGDRENPANITRDRMALIKERILAYAETNGQPPDSLAQLGMEPSVLTDHLGEPFQYSVEDGTVTLVSFGSDKKPGGTFFKKDYIESFDLP